MASKGDSGERGTTAAWIKKHQPIYDRATRHPFIRSIWEGTVDFSAFKRWLNAMNLMAVPMALTKLLQDIVLGEHTI